MASEPAPVGRFFVLKEEGGRYETECVDLDPVIGEAPCCPGCGDPMGMRAWLPPYRVELRLHGEAAADFVEASGYDLLVSERFARAFQAEGLSGLLGFHPVELVRVRQKRKGTRAPIVPRYVAVTACLARAAVDEAHSRIRRSEPISCMECRSTGVDAVHGFTLEQDSWQGEDIFRPRSLRGNLVVSARFAHFVERHGLTNMLLVPTEEFVWDPLGHGRAEPLPADGTQREPA